MSTRYLIVQGGQTVASSDTPITAENGHYRSATKAWLELTPDNAEVATEEVADPVVVPGAVTMRQARIALYGAGLLSSVDTAIDALAEPTKTLARIEWEYSNELQRGNALVAALTPALGLTDAQVDALFVQAATL